jgi:iron complex outermembrane receptor protein
MSGILMRKRLLGSTAIAGAFLLAAPAFAQDTPADTPATTDTAPKSDDIVVTGLRIPHPDLESASPVAIVGALEVKQTGMIRVEDFLNAMPQVFAG